MRYFFFAFETHGSSPSGGGAITLEHTSFPKMEVIKALIREKNPDFAAVTFHICSIFEFASEKDYRDFNDGATTN